MYASITCRVSGQAGRRSRLSTGSDYLGASGTISSRPLALLGWRRLSAMSARVVTKCHQGYQIVKVASGLQPHGGLCSDEFGNKCSSESG